MACTDMGLLLSKLVDGEVTPSERARVEEHLAGCAACRAELELLHKNERLVSDALAGEFFSASVVRAVMRDLPATGGLDAAGASPAPVLGARLRSLRPGLARAGRGLLAVAASPVAYAATLLVVLLWMVLDQSHRHDRLVDELVASLRAQREEAARPPKDSNEVAHQLAQLALLVARLTPPVVIQDPPQKDPEEAVVQRPVATPANPGETPHEAENPAPAVAVAPPPVVAEGKDLSVQAAPAEDSIRVEWMAAPQIHAMAYNIYRRRGAQEDFKPLNKDPLKSTQYVDGDVRPHEKYTYKVEAVTPDRPEKKVESPTVEVESHFDFALHFMGTMSPGGGMPEDAKFRVSHYQDGDWLDGGFSVRQGQTIGGTCFVPKAGRDINLSTRYKLVSIEKVQRPLAGNPSRSLVMGPDGKPKKGPDGKPMFETVQPELNQTVLRVHIVDDANHHHYLWSGERKRGADGLLQE